MKVIIRIFTLLFLIFSHVSFAQFNAVDYNFSPYANVLQNNPGSNLYYQKHFGIPFLNNTQLFAGNTGFSLVDLFAKNESFETKVFRTVNSLKNTDFVLTNYRQDLFSYGFINDLQVYKHFGLYWELDHITYMPADIIRLGFEGNASHQNDTYSFNTLATKTEFVQTIYYGVHKDLGNGFNFGYTFKLYSGIANAQSISNSGSFYTSEGTNNYYKHHLKDIDIKGQSSGYKENASVNYYLNKLLFSGNYGPGFDIGFSYQLNNRTQLSASLLDLGFIYYTTDINNYAINGSYEFEGASLDFPETGWIDYWEDIKTEFKEKIKRGKYKENYISIRPTTIYTSIKYGLGNLQHQSCENFLHPKSEQTSFIGLTGFSQYRPVKIHLGISAFYEQKWSKYFYTKMNYTIDNFSFASIGAGMVANIGRLQLFLSADNLFGLSNLAKSRKQSIHFGLNIIKF